MGVKSCSRRGCDQIMCDMYSNNFGYICWDCYNELKILGKRVTIEEFMDTPKGSDPAELTGEDIDDEFNV